MQPNNWEVLEDWQAIEKNAQASSVGRYAPDDIARSAQEDAMAMVGAMLAACVVAAMIGVMLAW